MKKIILIALLLFSPLHGKDEEKSKLGRLLEISEKVGTLSLKTVKLAYNHSDKILSKKTLTTAALLLAPYLYFNPEALTYLSGIGANMVIKMNGLIAEGILSGLMANPSAVANLMLLMSAESTGSAFAKGVGEKVAGSLLTLFTL